MKKILVIEDDLWYRKRMLAAFYAEWSGLEVEGVGSWKEAQEKLKDGGYDLVIADVILPDCEGDHIREMVKSGYRVLVITGRADRMFQEKIQTLGIVDYLLKSEGKQFDYLIKIINRLQKNSDKRVLVAEDSGLFRQMYTHLLERQNLSIRLAEDGLEALEILKQEPIHLIISDYEMPRMDGLALLREVRQHYTMLELPFIAISSSEHSETVALFLKLGANDYLRKPYSNEELLCRLNNTLDTIDMLQQIQTSAITDPLTGLYNRNYFYDIGIKSIEAAKRYNQALTVAMFDVDHFKWVNDTYGHSVGDQVLRAIGRLLKEHLREADIAIRFGGEEFLILMPSTDIKRSFIAMEKIRELIASKPIPIDSEQSLHVHVSGGLAALDSQSSIEEVIKRADEALYRAKKSGRNRIEMHQA